MTMDRPLVSSTTGESEVDRRYRAILRDLRVLLADHEDLLTELDAVVSELLAEADDRARIPCVVHLGDDVLPWEALAPILPPPLPVEGPTSSAISPLRSCRRRPRRSR
jgi:hypothetical protein